MLRFEGILIERMTARRWMAAVAAVFIIGSGIGWLVGVRSGRAQAVADLQGTARRAVDDLRKSDPLSAALLNAAARRADTHSRRLTSASRLRQIGISILVYANQHGGVGPADLDAVAADPDLSSDTFICPINGRHYVYRGYKDKAPENTVVAYEAPADPAEGFNVMFQDLHVEWVSGQKAASIAAQTAGK